MMHPSVGMQWQQPMPQQQLQPMPIPAMQQPNMMPAYNLQGQPINYHKRYNNLNYCWTHGCDIPDWHSSTTCPAPRQRHMVYANRANIMNSSTKGSHKVWLGQHQCQQHN
eukprot:4882664-Ditylum_brightwellii.AAC.2